MAQYVNLLLEHVLKQNHGYDMIDEEKSSYLYMSIVNAYNNEVMLKWAKEIIDEDTNGEVDVLYNNGACFEIAFENNNFKLMKLLLSHYEKQVLNKAARDPNTGFCLELKRLTDKVCYIVLHEVVSPEMAEILQNYMNDELRDNYDMELSRTSSFI